MKRPGCPTVIKLSCLQAAKERSVSPVDQPHSWPTEAKAGANSINEVFIELSGWIAPGRTPAKSS